MVLLAVLFGEYSGGSWRRGSSTLVRSGAKMLGVCSSCADSIWVRDFTFGKVSGIALCQTQHGQKTIAQLSSMLRQVAIVSTMNREAAEMLPMMVRSCVLIVRKVKLRTVKITNTEHRIGMASL